MKTSKILSWMLILSAVLALASCKDDDKDVTPSPSSYFTASIQYNNTAPETFTSDEFDFQARVDSSGNDTLIFEGERSSDGSYLYFNLIRDDLYSFAAGDSIAIPFDFATGTNIFCSLLIHSVSNTIFQPGGSQQGKVYIDDIDYSKNYIKGRMYGTFYSGSDSLVVSNGSFLIDL